MRKKQKKTNELRFRQWTRKNYAAFNSLHKVVTIGVLSISCSIAGQAQTSSKTDFQKKEISTDDPVIEKSDTLETIIVEGSMNAAILFSSSLQKEQIQQTAVQNTQDLLHYAQGVDLRSRGTEGVQADISLKGSTFDQTQVYLDNANLTDPQTGHYSLNLPLNLSDIRAVTTSDYHTGSVIFKSIHPSKTNATLQLSGGQYDYYQLMASGGIVNQKKQYIHLSASKTASDGFAYNTDFDILNLYAKAFTPLKNGSLNFQTGYQQKAYGANSFYSPAYKDQYEEIGCFIALLQYEQHFNRLSNQTTVYYRRQHDEFSLFRYEAPEWYSGNNYHLTDVIGVTSQLNYNWKQYGKSSLTIDYRNAHIYSSNLGEKLSSSKNDPYSSNGTFYYGDTQQHISASAGHQLNRDKWNSDLKITMAGNSNFGADFYGYIRGAYNPFRQLSIGIYAQNAYRIPTFTDLYYSSPSQQGNKNLNPEKIAGTGLSILWKTLHWKVTVNPFYKYGFELIDWVRLPLEEKWHCENLTNLQTIGSDISISYSLGNNHWLKQIEANYIYLAQNKTSGDYLSLYTTDYLRHQAKLSITHKIFKQLGASWLFSFQDRMGTYLDYNSKQETNYKPYLLCDLRISWDEKRYCIFAEASNLFNTNYQDIGNIEQPGIWAKAGIKLTFGN
jgi:iron complex outermembrane receptor protein